MKEEIKNLKQRINELESDFEKRLEEGTSYLKQSEEKFRLLFEKSQDPILIIDDYFFVECNDAAVKALGYISKEEIFKIHPSQLSPEYQPDGLKSYEKAQEMMNKAYKNGFHRFEWVHQNKKLEEIWMDIALTKIPYKGKDMIFTIWRDISEKKKFEKHIIESEKRFSSLFEQAADGILVGIKSGEIIEANESMVALTGYAKEELIGKNIAKLFEKEELGTKPLRYDLVKKGETVFRERNVIRKDGKVVTVEMNTKVLEDGRMQALFRDISKRKETEIALKESEEKYRNIFLNSPLGIIHYDSNGIITDCNEHFVNIIGSDKQKLIGLNMIYDLNNQAIIECVKKSLIKGESTYEDWYISVTANKKTFLRILFKSIRDENSKIVSGIGLVEDITERKIAEQNQKISEEKFKSIATLLPEVVFETDIQGNITFVNFKAYEIFEYLPEDFNKGLNLFQMLAPEDVKKAKLRLSQISENYKTVGEKYMAITKKGRRFPILVYSDVVKTNNQITGLRGIIVKIEELHNAQENLRKSEEKFRLLFENSNDAIFLMDNDIFIDCNDKTLKMFNCTRKQIVGISPYAFSPEYQPDGKKSKEKALEIIQEVLQGKTKIFEWVHKRYDGTEFYAEVSLNDLEYQNKKVIQAIVRDVSERKELEQAIFDAVIEAEEKERQRLASDIHDEIGPLLSSMKMYIESLNETNDVEKSKFLKTQLRSLIKESIVNVRDVSSALSPYILRKYGLGSAVKSFLENSKELIKISYETNLKEERFPINIETVFFRIIKELFNNTIKHAKAEKIKISLKVMDETLFLIYEDDGIGIKQSEFEKLERKGMGLFNITNRILSIKGNYKYHTNRDKGFKFEMNKKIETF